MLTNVAIIKYAEKFEKTLSKDKVTLKDVIEDYFPSKLASRILYYWEMRKTTFCTPNGAFKTDWKTVESSYFNNDKTFKFSLE